MYLFVTGSPRSGTSALTELLSAHDEISLGMERYKKLYYLDKVSREHFEKERFFSYDPEDTNVRIEGGRYEAFYRSLKEKYSRSRFLGDKYPNLFRYYDKLANVFGDEHTVVYIVRDVFRVASSWNVRARKENDKWPLTNDYRAAVENWNLANRLTLDSMRKGRRVIVAEYERLYRSEGDESYLETLLASIGVAPDAPLLAKYREQIGEFNATIENKPLTLDADEIAYIESLIDDASRDALLETFHGEKEA